jgi:hypothetical protein
VAAGSNNYEATVQSSRPKATAPPSASPMTVLSRLPRRVLAALFWMLTWLAVFVQTVAVAPADEPRMLIDEMSSAWPGHTPALLAIRPRTGHGRSNPSG